MQLYKQGVVMDTIDVVMNIHPIPDTLCWTWKTIYVTPERTITKDYNLYFKKGSNNEYILDEGEGLQLFSYVFENRMYSNFEVEGSMLTSVYILNNEKLIFEITSGKDIGKTAKDIRNFSVTNLQRSVLKRVIRGQK